MKFRPLHDRVVVRRLDAEEKTTGGIIIPDTAKEKPMEGEVIAAGPGARNEQGHLVALDVKAGDRILFGKWSGTEVKLDGEELLIMKESTTSSPRYHRGQSGGRQEEGRLTGPRLNVRKWFDEINQGGKARHGYCQGRAASAVMHGSGCCVGWISWPMQ